MSKKITNEELQQALKEVNEYQDNELGIGTRPYITVYRDNQGRREDEIAVSEKLVQVSALLLAVSLLGCVGGWLFYWIGR